MSIEALKQALEALENSIDTVRHEYETDWRHGLPTRKAQLDGMKQTLEQHESAITSLRQAIEQAQKQEPVAQLMDMIVGNLVREGVNKHRARELADHFIKQSNYTNGYCTVRTDLLKEQAAQKPVAWMKVGGMKAMPAHEKEAWLSTGRQFDRELVEEYSIPLYTTPPPRQPWVGLTDEDKQIAFDDTQEGGGFWEFADAIEATLRKKNHG